MAEAMFDRVQETTSLVGTGPVTTTGPTTGYRSFGSVMAVGDTTRFVIMDPTGPWEVVRGTYTGTNTLARTTVEASSNGGALVNFSGTAGTLVFMDATGAFLVSLTTGSNVGRNLVHNAMFRVNQRGVTSVTAAGGVPVDRWFHADNAAGSRTLSQVALTDADRAAIGDEAAINAVRIQTTGSSGAGDFELFYHNVESVRPTAGKVVTVSFWAKAAAAGSPIAFEMYQTFGSGGSPSSAVGAIGATKFTLTTAWARYFTTFTVPSVSGKTLGTTSGTDAISLGFWTSANSTFATRASNIGPQTSDIQMTGVQIELGGAATPLEKPSLSLDFLQCQRFYQQVRVDSFGYAPGGNTLGFPVSTTVPMRASPSTSVTGVTIGNGSGAMAVGYPNGVFFYYTVTSTGLSQTGGFVALTADL